MQKALRDGLNTIRLHDRDARERTSRKQQLRDDSDDCEASEPEFIDMCEGQGEDSSGEN